MNKIFYLPHIRLAIIKYLAIPALALFILVTHVRAADSDSGEFEEFGRHIVATLSAGDGRTFSEALGKEAILDSVFEGVSQDTKTAKDLRAGLAMGLDQAGQLMARNFKENARLTFLKLHYKNDSPHALIRIDFGDAGLNYLDLALHKEDSGAIKILDWYDYAKGQLYTDSVRQAIVLLLPDETSLFEKLLGVNKLNSKEGKQFVELAELLREQQYAEWLKKYNDLSPELRYSRILLLTRVQVASALGDESQYRLSLNDLHEQLGDDPTLSLILIDYYFYNNDFKAAHKALDNLSKHVGGDTAIVAMRANIYLSAEDYANSMEYSQRAITQDAAYEDAYWTLLNASILATQYDVAVATLKKLEDGFGYEFAPEGFEEEEAYAGFVKSDAYLKWKEQQANNNAE